MKFNRVISLLLSVVMILGMTSVVFAYNYDANNMPSMSNCKTWNIGDKTFSRMARYIMGEGGENNLYTSRLIASHMANLMEERGITSDSGINNLLNSWYSSMSDRGSSSDASWRAAEEVFKEGKRYLPRYITEFDGFCETYKKYKGSSHNFTIDGKSYYGDKKAALNAVNNAVRHKTKIQGPYGGKGLYYSNFNDGTNGNIFYYDPNGLLYNKYKGDNQYFDGNGSNGNGGYQEQGHKAVTVTIKGKAIKNNSNYGSAYINDDERTMVPLRAFAESAGCLVEWNGEKKLITLTKGSTKVKFWVGKKTFVKENFGVKKIEMDTAPIVENDRTYIPIRYAAEALGYKVSFNGEKLTVNCY